MESTQSPLSNDRRKQRQQESALRTLQDAFRRCQAANLVIVGYDRQLLAFDEDKLFAAGWTPQSDLSQITNHTGRRPVETNDVFITCISPDQTS